MNEEWIGWHFLASDRKLRYGDHSLVEVGKKLTVNPPLILCKWGLHASRRAIDALQYAPGKIICRVRLSGEIVHGDDKSVATERTVIAMADATNVLHEFACFVADDALDLVESRGQKVDPRSRNAIKVKRAFLAGTATQEELSAAESAAWSAAESAAESVSRSAAESAARSAARSAAWSAAWPAAWPAAWSAARSAALSASRSAALSAALSAQNAKLEAMLADILGITL